MSEYVLSAVVEMKDRFSAGIKKAQSGFSAFSKSLGDMPTIAGHTSESIKKMGESAVEAAQKTTKLKTALSSIKGVCSATIRVKDEASATVKKAQTELSQFKGKTYTAMLNVKQNLAKEGGVGGKLSNGMSGMAGGMLMGTSMQMAGAAGIGYGIYDTIKTYMDFEAQLSEIKALTGLDAAAMDQVKEKAMQLGQATVFGNTEVAKGMAELLKAGIDVKDVLGDASEAALNLAVAGEISLPDAAEIMSTAMNAFKVDDATHAADILAGAANASATGVSELKYSLAACSAVAAGAGMSFDDTNTALAVFAQNGLKGSDAGTSFKTMLSNLVPKGKTAIEAFKKLNLITENGSSAFFDEAGKMKSLASIADLLHDRMKDMTKEEQLSTLYDMFGSDGIRGGMILLREGAEGVTKMFEEMSQVTAKDVAITRMDNLKGDIEQLSGAWENFQDTLMDSHNSFGLRGFITELTDVVQYAGTVIKDGFDFSDIFKIAGKGIDDLKNKFLEFDGVGSVLAGGVLVGGLYKIIKLAKKAKDAITGLATKTNLPGAEGSTGSAVKDMVVNAQNVVINGTKSGTEIGSGSGTTILGPDGKPIKSTPKPSPKPKSRWSKLGSFVKRIPLLGTALVLGSGALDIAYAPDDKKGAAVGSTAGSLAGMWAGTKLGGAAGAAIGSVIPGAGTAAGAAIGGLAGGIGGMIGGDKLGQKLGDMIDTNGMAGQWEKIKNAASETWKWISNKASDSWQSMSSSLSNIADSFNSNIWIPLKNTGIDVFNVIVGIGATIWEGIEPYWDAAIDKIDANVWQPLKNSANGTWTNITDIWVGASGWFASEVWQPTANTAIWIWNGIGEFIINVWTTVQSIWSSASGWFESTVWEPISSGSSNVKEEIINAFSSAWSSAQGIWSSASGWFDNNVWNPIRNNLNWLGQKYNEFKLKGSHITGISGFATGTSYFAGGFAQINEHGGEIVDLPQGSRIYPAATTERIIDRQIKQGNGTSNGNVVITGNTFTVREEADIDRIAYKIKQLIQQNALNYGGI